MNKFLWVLLLVMLFSACQNNSDYTQRDKLNSTPRYVNNPVEKEEINTSENSSPDTTNNHSLSESPHHDTSTPPLLITDFQDRWNAISEEQTGDLLIKDFQQHDDPNQYKTNLKEGIFLEVYTRNNKDICQISIIASTNSDIYSMLTSWWQVLIITNPHTVANEIDAIFTEFGIGPNEKFEDIKSGNYSLENWNYEIFKTHDSISFKATLRDTAENTQQEGT